MDYFGFIVGKYPRNFIKDRERYLVYMPQKFLSKVKEENIDMTLIYKCSIIYTIHGQF